MYFIKIWSLYLQSIPSIFSFILFSKKFLKVISYEIALFCSKYKQEIKIIFKWFSIMISEILILWTKLQIKIYQSAIWVSMLATAKIVLPIFFSSDMLLYSFCFMSNYYSSIDVQVIVEFLNRLFTSLKILMRKLEKHAIFQ